MSKFYNTFQNAGVVHLLRISSPGACVLGEWGVGIEVARAFIRVFYETWEAHASSSPRLGFHACVADEAVVTMKSTKALGVKGLT